MNRKDPEQPAKPYDLIRAFSTHQYIIQYPLVCKWTAKTLMRLHNGAVRSGLLCPHTRRRHIFPDGFLFKLNHKMHHVLFYDINWYNLNYRGNILHGSTGKKPLWIGFTSGQTKQCVYWRYTYPIFSRWNLLFHVFFFFFFFSKQKT